MAENVTQKALYKRSSSAPAAAKSIEGIKTVFFDLDNTLIPTRSGDLKAIRKLADVLENQFSFTKEDSAAATQSFLKAFRRCPDNSQTSLDSWRIYLWREALPARYKHLAELVYPKWLQLRYRYLALQPEYVQMLRRFREANFFLALITNGPSNAQWEKIHKLHVSQFFDCVLVSSDMPWAKPNPNIFYAACNFLGVKPAECVMIGDKLESDIKGGRLAGLGATLWLPMNQTETDLTDVLYPPDIILRHLLDIYKYFPAITMSPTASSATTTASGNSATTGITHSQSTRRISQHSFNFSSTISASGNPARSTWECDREQAYQLQHQQNNQNRYTGGNKGRRGGSLPAMEYLNSETENSSDSLFN